MKSFLQRISNALDLFQKGASAESEKLLDMVCDEVKSMEESEERIKISRTLGEAWESTEHYDRALEVMLRNIQEAGNLYFGLKNGKSYSSYMDENQDAEDDEIQISNNPVLGRAANLFADSMLDAGNFHLFRLADYGRAMDYFMTAIELFEKTGNRKGIAYSFIGIGFVQREMSNYDESMDFFDKSEKICREEGIIPALISALNEKANLCVLMGRFDESERYRDKALELASEHRETNMLRFVFHDIGYTHRERGDYAGALKYLKKGLALDSDKRERAVTLANIGNVYLETKELKKAGELFLKSLALAEEIKYEPGILNVCEALADYYHELQDFREESRFLRRAASLRGKLYNDERSMHIAEMQVRYDLAEKEAETKIYRLRNIELAKANKRIEKQKRELERVLEDLQRAREEVKELSGLIPICSVCKRIRDDEGYWQQVEVYISEHSNADFTHGICPECAAELYPDLIERRKQQEQNDAQKE